MLTSYINWIVATTSALPVYAMSDICISVSMLVILYGYEIKECIAAIQDIFQSNLVN